jgi:hypothetical protein
MWLVENIYASNDLLMFIIFSCSLGASFKAFTVPNKSNFDLLSLGQHPENTYIL